MDPNYVMPLSPATRQGDRSANESGTTTSECREGFEKEIITKVLNMPAFNNMFLVANHQIDQDLMTKPIILIIGGPGSGKGTICDRIRANYGFAHLSTGDLLRDEVESGTERGKQLQEIMREGKLVSNEQVLDLLQSAIKSVAQETKGFLIDGYPREVGQAVDFETKISPATLVLYFDCPDTVMTQRLLNRGHGRVDDNIETIQKRLKVFHENAEPILKYFQNKVVYVNTDQDIDKVFDIVDAQIKKLFQ